MADDSWKKEMEELKRQVEEIKKEREAEKKEREARRADKERTRAERMREYAEMDARMAEINAARLAVIHRKQEADAEYYRMMRKSRMQYSRKGFTNMVQWVLYRILRG